MAAANPYEVQRNRVRQESMAAGQEQNEALKRRFARMGGLNSGSYAKASERLAGQQEQNQQRALEAVDVQEAMANEAKAEAQRGREFSRSERLGSQEFAGAQNALGRAFAREERLGSQGFQSSERLAGQGFAAGESALGRAFAREEAEKGRAAAESQFGRSLAETQAARGQQGQQWRDTFEQSKAQYADQKSLAERQFGQDEFTTKFNQAIAAHMAGIDRNILLEELRNPQAAAAKREAAYRSMAADQSLRTRSIRLASGGRR